MNNRNKLTAFGTAAVLAGAVGTYAVTASSQEAGLGPGAMHSMHQGMMGPGMMGMGPGMMGRGMMGADAAATADLGTIHELVASHDQIRRTVTNLPEGIRTVTESDDPRIAQLIKQHVARMGERVGAGRMLGVPIESPAVHALYANKDKIRTTSEPTASGIVVVQTSSDPKVIALLQQHAVEVSELVRGGMAAMHTAMMRNHGGMMGGAMHGPMMRGMDGDMRGMPHGGMMHDPR